MPASSMFCDLESNGFEEQRALQLAIELSMLGLDPTPGNQAHPETDPTPLPSAFLVPDEPPRKKSQNMTECVPVPSSEHVAEIVGRQGCKIKSLRAKTNTYIKTPVRGEEPVFVVTGRKEDVARAKKEILSAADHFSQIRASRKNNMGSVSPPGPPAVPGQVTIQVRVPYRVVGLVVGPKGATIKRIQHQTHTYIVTPSRDKEPVFEVTGLPEQVEAAKRDIEAHIALRTGTGLVETPELLASLYKSGFGPLIDYMDSLGSSTSSGCSSASSSSGAALADIGSTIWSASLDEGLGDSPSFEPAGIWSFPGNTTSSPAESVSGRRECTVCTEREVSSALVPCGHNLFCGECAERLARAPSPQCPACKQSVLSTIRIQT